jgi:hypothetical protein
MAKTHDLPADNTFGISFDTNTVRKTGILKVVQVKLEEATLAPEETVHVNLSEHPLYPALVRYVLANPPRKP